MREAEEVKGLGAGRVAPVFAPKINEPRFLGVQRQAVLAESLRQYFEDASRVVAPRKDQDHVVRVTDEPRAPFQARQHVATKPQVHDFVQVDVREQGRHDAALRRSGLGMLDASLLHYARVQPLSDNAQQDAITYPAADDLEQVSVIEAVEKLPDIDFQDPTSAHRHRRVSDRFERLVRRATRPEAVRAVQEVLLVDGLQQHRDRALQHLILEGRNANGSRLLPISLRDVHAPDGGARYAPDLKRSRSDWRFSSSFSAYSFAVCPSMPVAPSLRVRRYASRSQSTSM